MKIAVAMSGGIDSTVAAIKLLEQGHEIIGVTARILRSVETARPDLCFTDDSLEDARQVATTYGFPHHTIDTVDDFAASIIEPFCQDYLKGLTPNPCIHCNPKIKFREVMTFAKKEGCDAIATGHYAQVHHEQDRYFVRSGVVPRKDQSYFLYQLSQDILHKLVLPLGESTKEEIFQLGSEHGLAVADKPESREICFVQENDYATFIEQWTGKTPPPGDIVDAQGNVLGQHTGIHRYTIGQRRGLGIAAPNPLYVIGIDANNNRIIAGYWDEQHSHGLEAYNLHHMKSLDLSHDRILVKTRSTQPPLWAGSVEDNGILKVVFEEPLIGVTAGQAAVLYNESMDVLGGGIITRSLSQEEA